MQTEQMTQQPIVTRESILALLATSESAVVRALQTLTARQTTEERESQTTRERNARGFTAYDAAFLTSVAQRLPAYGNRMTPRQLAACRKLLPKYWRQLMDEAQSKGHAVLWPAESVKTEASKPMQQWQDIEHPVEEGLWA